MMLAATRNFETESYDSNDVLSTQAGEHHRKFGQGSRVAMAISGLAVAVGSFFVPQDAAYAEKCSEPESEVSINCESLDTTNDATALPTIEAETNGSEDELILTVENNRRVDGGVEGVERAENSPLQGIATVLTTGGLALLFFFSCSSKEADKGSESLF